jgi:hypothetical protein
MVSPIDGAPGSAGPPLVLQAVAGLAGADVTVVKEERERSWAQAATATSASASTTAVGGG